MYHMKPAAAPTPDGRSAGADAAVPAPGRGGRGRGGSGFSSSQVTPLVVNGMMYLATPYYRVVAVDPTTGKEVWAYPAPIRKSVDARRRVLAGRRADAAADRLRLERRQAVLARREDRQAQRGLRRQGRRRISNTPEIMQGLPGRNGLSSPPIVYRNLVITGGKKQENPPRGPAGDVRAWDMRTGKLVWTFRSIPRAGEKYNDTWAGDSWKNRSGVNVWGFMTVDVERGIVYMPFGAPSVDQYGGDREGDNLFGTSLVAADANTGKYLWHFQVVHHDIWDADLAARAGAHRREAGRPDDSRRRGDRQDGPAVPARSGHRQADLRRRGTSGAAKRSAAGANVEDAAIPAQAAAALAHDACRRRTSRRSRPSSKRRAGS